MARKCEVKKNQMQVLKVVLTGTELFNREKKNIRLEKELDVNVGIAYIIQLFYTHV